MHAAICPRAACAILRARFRIRTVLAVRDEYIERCLRPVQAAGKPACLGGSALASCGPGGNAMTGAGQDGVGAQERSVEAAVASSHSSRSGVEVTRTANSRPFAAVSPTTRACSSHQLAYRCGAVSGLRVDMRVAIHVTWCGVLWATDVIHAA